MPGFDWQKFVATEEIVVVTRFSFLGTSGWKSEFSRNQDELFEQGQLELRLTLMETVNLPSLAGQTDQNFHLFVLTSMLLPRWAAKALKILCQTHLPAGKFTIAPKAPGVASTYLRRFLRLRCNSGRSFHTILDDVDALASDFLQRLRERMSELSAPAEGEMRFVSL